MFAKYKRKENVLINKQKNTHKQYKIYVNYKSITCPRCGRKLYIKDIYDIIRTKYLEASYNNDFYSNKGYLIEINTLCKCDKVCTIELDCHLNKELGMTVVADHVFTE